MTNKTYLLSHRYQKFGWMAFAISLIALVVLLGQDIIGLCPDSSILGTLATMWTRFVSPIAIFILCMTQEKVEDEYIQHIRARSIYNVVLLAFIIAVVNTPLSYLLSRFVGLNVLGRYLTCVEIFKMAIPLACVYLIIFKGTLLLNWLNTRKNDGQ